MVRKVFEHARQGGPLRSWEACASQLSPEWRAEAAIWPKTSKPAVGVANI
jgi:hypothetical protein